MSRRASLILLAPVVIVLGLVQATLSQLPEKKFATKDGKKPTGLFAPGVMVGKTMYVAGKGDYRPQDPFPEKVKNCLNEVRKTLQVAGLDLQHVVKSFVYLEDHDKFADFNKAYAEFFKNDPPARTTLGVAEVPGDSRVEITCIAYSDLTEKKPVGNPPPGLPFSPGVRAGDTVYISGKGDQLPDGGHPPTFEAQVRQCMKNVEATLKQAGLDFRHVVMSHVFLDKSDNLPVADKVYGEFFERGHEPACATVLVDWIPGGSHVEVTCIATTDLKGRKEVRPAGQIIGPLTGAVTASPAVWAGDTLYLSGLSGLKFSKPSNTAATPGLGEQVHQMARNHVEVLEAAGLKLDDIVSGHVYLRDMKDYNPMNAIYREYFSRGPGVRTCLMPTSRSQSSNLHVSASFIAARTR
ncbi:MAG TPA: RidA family protein [Gemmataceae bacterium]|jgi:2-iminobutanoate/2-iminopropanoate deaminase|nr:RidA family protein [Gemmataceae bacterium]